jgi:hypothetical protein
LADLGKLSSEVCKHPHPVAVTNEQRVKKMLPGEYYFQRIRLVTMANTEIIGHRIIMREWP